METRGFTNIVENNEIDIKLAELEEKQRKANRKRRRMRVSKVSLTTRNFLLKSNKPVRSNGQCGHAPGQPTVYMVTQP